MKKSRLIPTLLVLFSIVPLYPAGAALMLDVMGPPGITVEEGASGAIDFVIKNTGTVDTTIDTITKPLIGDIRFLFGDMRDEVFRTTLTDPNNCVMKVLMPAAVCAFRQAFDTRDLDKPNSGQNEGVWQMLNRVDFHETANAGNADIALGATQVHVVDPMFISTPVPSSFILTGSAWVVLIAHAWRRRRRKVTRGPCSTSQPPEKGTHEPGRGDCLPGA